MTTRQNLATSSSVLGLYWLKRIRRPGTHSNSKQLHLAFWAFASPTVEKRVKVVSDKNDIWTMTRVRPDAKATDETLVVQRLSQRAQSSRECCYVGDETVPPATAGSTILESARVD
jgi:hypothetical protein